MEGLLITSFMVSTKIILLVYLSDTNNNERHSIPVPTDD